MLRITIDEAEDFTTLRLEGKLLSTSLFALLEAYAVAAESGKGIILDLSGLCTMDFYGRRLLSELHRRGARLIGSGLVVRGLIEELTASFP